MYNLACHLTSFKNLKMDLKNLNLVELNAQEMKEVEGGFLFAFILGLGLGILLLKSIEAIFE